MAIFDAFRYFAKRPRGALYYSCPELNLWHHYLIFIKISSVGGGLSVVVKQINLHYYSDNDNIIIDSSPPLKTLQEEEIDGDYSPHATGKENYSPPHVNVSRHAAHHDTPKVCRRLNVFKGSAVIQQVMYIIGIRARSFDELVLTLPLLPLLKPNL